MDFSNVCRSCLGTQSLNPIFKVTDEHTRYSTAINIATGIKVELNDGLPQNMCTSCISHLNNSLEFRKLCKDTESQLLIIKGKLDSEACNLLAQTCEKNTAKRKKSQENATSTCDALEIKTEYTDAGIPSSDEDDKPLKELIDSTSDVDAQQPQNISTETASIIAYEPPYLSTQKSNRVTCQLCQKELSVRSMGAHVARRHPGADARRDKCALCDAHVLRQRMARHRSLVHGPAGYRCGYCKSEFDNKEVLIEHTTTCTAKKKKRQVSESSRELRQCDICHKTMQKASLRLHKAVKHAGLGPVCEHCGKRFGNKFRLNEHYRAKHGYEKFKCSYCDFQSAAIMAMRNHERRHRGEKPFVCESCGAKFHAAYLLAQHKQSHRTEKLVKCDQCPASFKANNSLHMHKLTCHSASVYKCTMCARAYSCRHYAVKHIRLVHQYRGPVPRLQRLPAPQPDAAN